MKKIAFFSDLHLSTNSEDPANKAFLKTLYSLRTEEQIDGLILLGDIFDLLVGPFGFWEHQHQRIFGELALLSKSGCKIYWCEGNHDFHISHLKERLGVEVFDDHKIIFIKNKNGKNTKLYLAHGDLVPKDDLTYLRWRAQTRSPVWRSILSKTPPLWAKSLLEPAAQFLSKESRKKSYAGRRDGAETIKTRYRAFSEEKWTQDFDAIFLGHCHVPDLHKQQDTDKFYLNLGSWIMPNPIFNVKYPYAIWDVEQSNIPEIKEAL